MGKTKKSRWGHLPNVANDKIDMSNPEKELSKAKERAKAYIRQNPDNLYKISTTKNTSTAAVKILKSNKKSEIEEKKVEKIVKRLEKQKNDKNINQDTMIKTSKVQIPIFDVWDAPNIAFKEKPILKRYDHITNKAVVLPESGLSYNPTLTAYENTIERVVKDNVKKVDPKSVELIKKRTKHKIEKRKQIANINRNSNLAGRSTNEKQILKQRDEQLKEKKLQNLVDNYEKEFDNKIRELSNKQKKHDKYLSNKAQKSEDIKSGKLQTYNLKLSKHKLPTYVPPSLSLPEDMPENLRKIKTDATANIRDHFESVYRRGLIEYKKIGKVQRRAKVKYHNKHTAKEDFYIDPNN